MAAITTSVHRNVRVTIRYDWRILSVTRAEEAHRGKVDEAFAHSGRGLGAHRNSLQDRECYPLYVT